MAMVGVALFGKAIDKPSFEHLPGSRHLLTELILMESTSANLTGLIVVSHPDNASFSLAIARIYCCYRYA
jgi:hypothetical protein